MEDKKKNKEDKKKMIVAILKSKMGKNKKGSIAEKINFGGKNEDK